MQFHHPTRRRPRPPCCALDLRALALFRITFILFYLAEFIVERIPDLLQTNGCRHENMAPAEFFSWHGGIHSIYFLSSDPKFHVAILALTFLCCLFVLVGYATTPAALLLMYLDRAFINRNFMANDGHVYLMNRMFLAIAFTACDHVRVNWSHVLPRGCRSSHRSHPSPTSIKITTAIPPLDSYHYYDNSWGSVLIYTSIIMLWLGIGLEKLLEWNIWFVEASAIQFICIGNHAYWFGYLLASVQALYLPRIVSQWLCRLIVLLEFPLGPLALIWPSDHVRTLGVCATGGSLLMFGSMLAVDWFPFSVFVVQVALFPASLMDRCGNCFVRKEGSGVENEGSTVGNKGSTVGNKGSGVGNKGSGVGNKGSTVETENSTVENEGSTAENESSTKGSTTDNEHSTVEDAMRQQDKDPIENGVATHIRGLSYLSLPSITYLLPPPSPLVHHHPPSRPPTHLFHMFDTTMQYVVHGFLGSCVFLVVFCGVRESLNFRGESGQSVALMSTKWDHALNQQGIALSLSTGWKAVTPPNVHVQWHVLVGYPIHENSTWENTDEWGIHVQFRSDPYSKSIEGTSVRHAFFNPPPDMLFSGSRQFLVNKEKFFHRVFNEDHLVPRKKIFKQFCQAFHQRHPLPEQRIGSLRLYTLTQLIEDPWSHPPRLGNVQQRLIDFLSC